MLIWRIILAGKATMTELSTVWSFEDVINCNILLDVQGEMTADSVSDCADVINNVGT